MTPYVNIDNPSNHWVGKKPCATLVTWTPRPLETMLHAWEFAKGIKRKEPATREELVSFFRRSITDWIPVGEFVHFTFECHFIPRALLDQMTRHRHWSFFVQSMRVADMSYFAKEGEYFVPDSASVDPNTKYWYDCAMSMAEHAYRKLVDAGVPREDARGVLPLHVQTKLVVGFNLRAFYEGVRKRTCLILQQEYWAPLLNCMRQELVAKVDPELAFIFQPPCDMNNTCITKIEQEERLSGRDPNPPCVKYDAKRNIS